MGGAYSTCERNGKYIIITKFRPEKPESKLVTDLFRKSYIIT
jgi:hypothetical protein